MDGSRKRPSPHRNKEYGLCNEAHHTKDVYCIIVWFKEEAEPARNLFLQGWYTTCITRKCKRPSLHAEKFRNFCNLDVGYLPGASPTEDDILLKRNVLLELWTLKTMDT